MKAAVYHGRGDIQVEPVPDPADPGPAEVVLQVTRAAICGTDAAEWAHGPLLARPPVVLGHEFAGTVVAVGDAAGDAASGLATGDRVVCGAGVSCGGCAWCRAGRTNLCASYFTLGLHADGGLAEFAVTPVAICQRVPETVTDDATAMAQPLAVALHAVRRAGVEAGQACVVLAATGDEGAHVVIEASGAPHAPAAALAATRRGGRVLLVGLQAAPRELDLFSVTVREIDVATTLAHRLRHRPARRGRPAGADRSRRRRARPGDPPRSAGRREDPTPLRWHRPRQDRGRPPPAVNSSMAAALASGH